MKNINRILDTVFRQCVFILINSYALSKIFGGQFYMNGNLPPEIANTTLGEVSNFNLAWTFMGHSFAYILFIGIIQITGSWLLLWNRTKLIGAFILIPIMANIVVFDIIFELGYPAVINAIIVFSMLIAILFLNKEHLTSVYQSLTQFPEKYTLKLKGKVVIFGITLLILALIFTVDSFIDQWIGINP